MTYINISIMGNNRAGTRAEKPACKRRALCKLSVILLACIMLTSNVAGAYAASGTPSTVEVETAPGIMAVGDNIVDTAGDSDEGESPAGESPSDGGNGGMDLPETQSGEAAYKKISGEITLIDVWNDYQFVRVMNAEGGETDFVIDENRTVFSDLSGLTDFDAIATGKKVDAYYVEPLFMTLQYPARFTADVIVIRDENNPGDAFVGVIDSDGRASDGSVVLNIADDIPITRHFNGLTVDKSWLNNRVIIAYYAITTRSYPPVAIVQKVIVLDGLGVPVYLNGARLYNAEAFVKNDGTVLAPLRAIVEALGQTVDWDAERMSARVGVAIYVTIGSDEYVVGRAMPIKLEAAAVLINDRTYAPISFYESILNLKYENVNGLVKLSVE